MPAKSKAQQRLAGMSRTAKGRARTEITQERRKIELYVSGGSLYIDTAGVDWFTMTPDEARRFAVALIEMADKLTAEAA